MFPTFIAFLGPHTWPCIDTSSNTHAHLGLCQGRKEERTQEEHTWTRFHVSEGKIREVVLNFLFFNLS